MTSSKDLINTNETVDQLGDTICRIGDFLSSSSSPIQDNAVKDRIAADVHKLRVKLIERAREQLVLDRDVVHEAQISSLPTEKLQEIASGSFEQDSSPQTVLENFGLGSLRINTPALKAAVEAEQKQAEDMAKMVDYNFIPTDANGEPVKTGRGEAKSGDGTIKIDTEGAEEFFRGIHEGMKSLEQHNLSEMIRRFLDVGTEDEEARRANFILDELPALHSIDLAYFHQVLDAKFAHHLEGEPDDVWPVEICLIGHEEGSRDYRIIPWVALDGDTRPMRTAIEEYFNLYPKMTNIGLLKQPGYNTRNYKITVYEDENPDRAFTNEVKEYLEGTCEHDQAALDQDPALSRQVSEDLARADAAEGDLGVPEGYEKVQIDSDLMKLIAETYDIDVNLLVYSINPGDPFVVATWGLNELAMVAQTIVRSRKFAESTDVSDLPGYDAKTFVKRAPEETSRDHCGEQVLMLSADGSIGKCVDRDLVHGIPAMELEPGVKVVPKQGPTGYSLDDLQIDPDLDVTVDVDVEVDDFEGPLEGGEYIHVNRHISVGAASIGHSASLPTEFVEKLLDNNAILIDVERAIVVFGQPWEIKDVLKAFDDADVDVFTDDPEQVTEKLDLEGITASTNLQELVTEAHVTACMDSVVQRMKLQEKMLTKDPEREEVWGSVESDDPTVQAHEDGLWDAEESVENVNTTPRTETVMSADTAQDGAFMLMEISNRNPLTVRSAKFYGKDGELIWETDDGVMVAVEAKHVQVSVTEDRTVDEAEDLAKKVMSIIAEQAYGQEGSL